MKNIGLTILAMLLVKLSIAQSLEGKVVDAKTGEGIPFASVLITGVQVGTIADENGKFQFETSLPEVVSIRVSAELYESRIIEVKSGESLEIKLEASHLDVQEVVVILPAGVMQRDNTVRVERLDLKELNAIPAANLSEAIANMNGVQQASMGTGISKPVIRGMQGVRVLTVWNGLRIENQQWGGDHGLGISQLGIGAVEVIKGPSSLLYGADAFGGVLYLVEEGYAKQNAYSLDVSSKFESVNLGTTNTAMFKMARKNVRFNIGGIYSNMADFQLPNGKYLSDSRYKDQGIKARLGVNKDKWVMQLNYMYSNSYNGIPGHSHDSMPLPEDFMLSVQNRSQSVPGQHIRNHFASLDNKFFLKRNVVQLQVGFTHNDLAEFEEKITIPGLRMQLTNALYHARYNARFGKWNLSTGLQGMYQLNKNGSDAEEQLIPDFDQLDNGAYAIMNFGNNSPFSFQFGGRYDLRILNSGDFSSSYGSPNFSIGGKYQWYALGKQTLRLNVSSGFRAPHVSELLVDGKHHGALRYEVGNTALKSERATQFDLNYEFEQDHISFVLNPFYNYIQNYTQIVSKDSIVEGLPLFNYEQIDQAQLYGVDLGIHYHPHFAHWLHIESSYSLIYGESFSAQPMSLIPQPRLNNLVRLKFKKKWKFNLEEIVLQHMHFFEQNRISPYETASVDYDVIHAGLNFKWYMKNPLNISVGVKNALNAQYVNHLSRLKNIGVYDPGRNIYISVSYQLKGKLNNNNIPTGDQLEAIPVRTN